METERRNSFAGITVPLSEVTVCAHSERAFDFLNHDLTCTGLLLSICQKKILLKQGEKFPAPDDLSQFTKNELFEENIFNDLLVLQCRPLYSGLLSLKTQIIVVDKYDKTLNPKGVMPVIQYKEVPVLSDFLVNLSVSNSSTSIGNILDRIVLNQKDASFRHASLKLFLNFKKFQDTLLHCGFNSAVEIDVCNAVLLEECSVSKFNLYDGDWIEIKVKSEHQGRTSEGKAKVCQVRVVKDIITNSEEQDFSGFYALPQLFHALKIQDLRRSEGGIEIIYRRCPGVVGAGEEGYSVSSGGAPPVVKELHIACVQSPTYSPGDSYKQLLQNYFLTPRTVTLGTILSVDTEDDPEYWQNVTEISEMRKPVLYFKVMKLHPKLNGCKVYIASSQETTLYLDGTVQSFVPSLMSYSFKSTKNKTLISPPGLKEYVDVIVNLILPYVNHSSSPSTPSRSVYPSVLVSGQSGCGKTSVVAAVCGYLNMHCYQVNCHELCGETSGATEARIKHTLQRASSFTPCVLLLRSIDALGKDRDGNSEDPRVASSFIEQINTLATEQVSKLPVVVIATTSSMKSLSTDLQEGFLHQVEIGSPSEGIRGRMLAEALSEVQLERDVNLRHIAQRTAGMVLGDIQALVSFVKKAALERITTYCKTALGRSVLSWREESSIERVGYPLCSEDFNAALDHLQATHSDSLGAPKIPNVKWEDIGGLTSVKSEILDTIQLPLQHPELFASGMRRSGVLLYGPPGTGKTLLAKAVATECSLNFLNVKGPELINMYVGQSEENIREVFHRARNASPCVIFFDELDSLAPNRGRSGDSGGVMDRVVSQMLAELDGLHKAADVFVIGATNRPDLLDPALLRPGRFDKLLYLGVSEDRTSQLKILEALTRKFKLEGNLQLAEVVQDLPYNLTGADIYALCSDAMLNALKRKIKCLDQGEEVDQGCVKVTLLDFNKAVECVVPSISIAELQHYKSVQTQFNASKLTV